MDLITLLQPLLGEDFCLRQRQKTPAVQESRSEDAVEVLDNRICQGRIRTLKKINRKPHR